MAQRILVKVGESDMAFRLDIDNDTQIVVDNSSHIKRHQSSAVTDGNTTLVDEPLRMGGVDITVNTTQPVVTGVFGSNGDGERSDEQMIVSCLCLARIYMINVLLRCRSTSLPGQ